MRRGVLTQFIIEHQCPQCGAPAELEETDRLFRCPYCRVNSYLLSPGFFRYVMPHHAPAGKQVIYYPYWRFKGMLFSCLNRKIETRFLDVSHQALESPLFPWNIGFRGQTQKLRFAVSNGEDIFMRSDLAFEKLVDRWSLQYSARLPKPILHQDYIGEVHSLVYAPFYLDSKIYDAILNQPVSDTSVQDIPDGLLRADFADWPIRFLATLCPQCGWDLDGDRDSLALHCPNCRSVWWARKGKLSQLNCAHIPSDGDRIVFLPFWRIQADVSRVPLSSYADLVKAANLPRVPQPGWEQQPFHFWTPAFKVRPQSYLTIATSVTLSQPEDALRPCQPPGSVQAINLPLEEALESLKMILANFLKPIERKSEWLPQIRIQGRRFLLVYIPFRQTHHELVHDGLNLAINKNTLAHAKNL